MANPETMDFGPYIRFVRDRLEEYRISAGQFQRHILRTGHPTEGRADAYGTADAANILYTLGDLPGDAHRRQALINGIQEFQRADTGIFVDPTHSDYHTTAHCVAALELFDTRPAHRLTFLAPVVDEPGALEEFLDNLPWSTKPWPGSHDGAGIAAALALTGEAPASWFTRYFRWLDDEVDPATGLWRRDRMLPMSETPGLFANMAGSFHYHFNYVYFRRAIPYPERVIDTCLDLLHNSPVTVAEKDVVFKDIDWIFCVNRAQRQCHHRRAETHDALVLVAGRMHRVLSDPAYLNSTEFDDLHNIFGGLCALAEMQAAIPGLIETPRPLRLVLDRRPFI